MTKIRITPIDQEQTWFNICQDQADESIPDVDISVKEALIKFIGSRTYTLWKTADSENYVIQIHPG